MNQISPAKVILRRLKGVAKKDARLWLELSASQAHEGALLNSKKSLLHAISLPSCKAQGFLMAGEVARKLDDFPLALECFCKGESAAPVLANMAAAELCERLNRLDEAAEHLEALDALKDKIHLGAAPNILKSKILTRTNKADEATDILTQITAKSQSSPTSNIEAYHALFQAYDKLGEYASAYQALTQSKEANLKYFGKDRAAGMQQTKKLSYQRLASIIQNWNTDELKLWKEHSKSQLNVNFLIGHPRSGTTLIENILDSHDGITSSDERTVFQDVVIDPIMRDFTPPPEGDEQAEEAFREYVHELDTRQVKNYGRRYQSKLEEQMGRKLSNTVLLDKNPAITDGGLLALRIFPHSKFILALRDPRAVTWSSFTLPMVGASWMGSFWFDLEATAEAYSLFSDVLLAFKEKVPENQVHLTRYEETVADPEKTGRSATEFLGLEWEEKQSVFYERAGEKHVHSPTYADVAKPVYSSALDKWRNYEKYMEGALPQLDRCLEKLGYS